MKRTDVGNIAWLPDSSSNKRKAIVRRPPKSDSNNCDDDVRSGCGDELSVILTDTRRATLTRQINPRLDCQIT